MTPRDLRRRVLRPLVAALAMLATLHGLSGMSCPHVAAAAHDASRGASAAPSHAEANHAEANHAGANHAERGHHGASAAHATDTDEHEGNPMPGCQCPGTCLCTPLAVAAFVPREAWTADPVHETASRPVEVVVPATRITWRLPPATAPPILLAAA